ncbi:MAG: pyridoxal phosphate-dependent decarboxylase family protein [Chloroflexota bacterium]
MPYGLRIGHPGFLGWVTTGPSIVPVAAGLAQAVAAPQRWWVHPANHLDSLAVTWIRDLLGFPAHVVGTFTSGGATANLVGLGAARQHAGELRGIDPSCDGVAALHEPRVYVTDATHHVVGRALGVLGLGRANAVAIPRDGERRMDLRALDAALRSDIAAGRTPVAVVGNAGDVNTGIVDPLGPMAEIAHGHGTWLHVDGAYGGWGLLDPRVRERFGDPGAYDSFAVDPHKWMAVPVGTGLALCRDRDILARAFRIEMGDYDRERESIQAALADGTGDTLPWEELGRGNPDWGVDFSTPARGLAVWALLKEIGADGMRARIVRHDDAARTLADAVRAHPDLELLAEPELSICCFRYRPADVPDGAEADALNTAILRALRRDGRSLPSATTVDGRFALRACFLNPRNETVEAAILADAVIAAGRAVRAGGDPALRAATAAR